MTSDLPEIENGSSGLDIILFGEAEADIEKADGPRDFVLSLKTDQPEKRPDGRIESRITYEYRFSKPSKPSLIAQASTTKLFAPWSAFEPTYRGRPADNAPELDLTHLTELSLMCRSNFGKQSGDFSLVLGQISLRKERTLRGWVFPIDWLFGTLSALLARISSLFRGSGVRI